MIYFIKLIILIIDTKNLIYNSMKDEVVGTQSSPPKTGGGGVAYVTKRRGGMGAIRNADITPKEKK